MPTILPYAVGQQAVFTFSKAWVCPPDVTSVVATGFGGGGSGAGAATASDTIGQGGGGGTLMSSLSIAVVPGTAYLITIGTGGVGGAKSSAGNAGGDTTFSQSGTVLGTWSGASGGQFITSTGGGGGQPHKATGGGNLFTGISTAGSHTIAAGADAGGTSGAAGNAGFRNVVGGFNGGAGGALSTEGGGSGGGAGPEGVGGTGGAGSSGTGSPGVSGAANTGAGGGGGGAGGTAGGIGGAGGSGKLYLSYVSKYASIIQITPPISNGLVLVLDSRLGISGASSVSFWADQSGTADINKNCLQATAANQPSYNPNNSSFNGKPSIDFNGTTGYLVSGTWSSALAQPFTSLAVGVSNSSGNNAMLIDNLAAHQTSMQDSSGTYEIFAGSATLNDSSGLVMTNPFAIGATFNGASSQLWAKQKTAQAIGTNPGANNMTGTTIGGLGSAPGNTTNSWNGSIAFIAIYNRTLSAAEMSAMMDWLGTTYNITIGA